MKLREVFRYELAYRLRSVSTWAYAAILLGLACAIMLGASPRAAVDANAPVQVAVLMMILGLFGLAVSAAIFGDAAVRDFRSAMDPLLFTSSLRRTDYLGGRFLAALTTNAVVLLAIPLGLALPVLFGYPDAARYGPLRALAYVQPWLLLLLPDMVFAGAVLFTTGVLSRKIVPVYLVAIGLFVGTMVLLGPDADDTVSRVMSIVGPLGFPAVIELSAYWTPAERNARLIGLPASLLLNRALWLAIAAVVLAVLHGRFRFAHPDGGRRRRKARRIVDELQTGNAATANVARVSNAASSVRANAGSSMRDATSRVLTFAGSSVRERSFDWRTTARQTLAIARRSLADVAGSRWFAVVLVACTGLTVLWGWNVGDTVFDTSTWPVTLLVAGTVLSRRVVPLIWVLIVLYAGELTWQEREAGDAEIADATPVPDGAVLLGRFLALVAMLVMFQATCMLGGTLIQAFQGYDHFEPGLYLRIAFGLNLADYVLLAVLAMTIHVIVNHKYIGHIVALIAILFTRFAGPLGIRHHLLVYGTDPGWTYSDMNGFGPFTRPFVWFKLYWAAWAMLLGVAAVLFHLRGREPGVRHRLGVARARFAGPVTRAAGLALALILVLGGFVYYNTNILNPYRSPDEAGTTQATYERRYRRFDDVAQPVISDAKLRIEIHPEVPAVDLGGTYRLVNRTAEAIDSVHVLTVPPVRVGSIGFGRAAEPMVVDDEVGYRIYALERALEPGDSIELEFDVAFRPHGFPNSGIETEVVGNGAYFDRMWLPFIGYQPAFELGGAEARRQLGLDPHRPMPSPEDTQAKPFRLQIRDPDRVHVDAIIGTAEDQTVVTPGILRRSWTENGRRYFHYETGMPISFGNAVFSAKYAVLEDGWDDVALRIYHHPSHTFDLDRMVRSMKASLEYYTTTFGPWPDRQLSIVEVPRYGVVGRAHPHTIAFGEGVFLNRVRDGEVDQPFFGTAHEIAHQWWGGQVRGAPVLGHGLLTESLANYSAMMVVEETYGPEMARRVYDFQLERYLRGRASFSHEVPLLLVDDQAYIAYRKGAIALYTLRELIGADSVNAALRRYLEKYRSAGPPGPTSLDLYAELRAATPDSLRSVLTDLFEEITLWDVRAKRAGVERTAGGEYRVTLDVAAKKVRADSLGNETEVPMDDLVEIGVFAAGSAGIPGEPLYLQRRRIHSGEQTITVTVPREPARAGIDPRHWLIDRNRNDNVITLEPGTAGAE